MVRDPQIVVGCPIPWKLGETTEHRGGEDMQVKDTGWVKGVRVS